MSKWYSTYRQTFSAPHSGFPRGFPALHRATKFLVPYSVALRPLAAVPLQCYNNGFFLKTISRKKSFPLVCGSLQALRPRNCGWCGPKTRHWKFQREGVLEAHVDSEKSQFLAGRTLNYGSAQWSNCGGTRRNGVPLPFLAGERRSPSLHDDIYLQHMQQKKMCVKYMI